jgi:hypothetical protein
MTVATDLTDFHTMETTPTSFEFTNYTQGGTPTIETDFYIQGSQCMSAQMTKTGLGSIGIDFGSNPTWTSGWSFFLWGVFLPSNAVNTDGNGGLRVLIGSATTAFKVWYVGGRDFGRYPYGGWQNFAVNPEVTADVTVGTPTAGQYRYAGFGVDCTAAIARGYPLGLDAIRFGRGEIRVSGTETFATMATANDGTTAKWGLFQAEAGSYLWKGLMTLGSGTTVSMTDSNKNILVDNTRKVTSSFNRIEIRQGGSTVDWTGINFSALGTVSKGQLEVIDNASVDMTTCSFTDMDTFIFRTQTTLTGTTFRRCGRVTLGGATMSGCLFDDSTAAIALACGSSVSSLSNTDFVSSGTGHALEITGGSSHTFTGLTFTGYAGANGSTGNEAVYVNIPSGSVTIYADSTFSYRTAGATVTIIAGSVTATLTVTNVSGSPISGAQVMVAAASAAGDLPYQETITITNSGTTATVSHTAHGMLTNDKVLIKGASLYQNNGVFTITVTGANSYTYTMASAPVSNPTGTNQATFVALSGTTDVNGQISMSRVFSIDQPVSGWARKSSSSPYYKTGQVAGLIDSTTGANLSALLISDE